MWCNLGNGTLHEKKIFLTWWLLLMERGFTSIWHRKDLLIDLKFTEIQQFELVNLKNSTCEKIKFQVWIMIILKNKMFTLENCSIDFSRMLYYTVYMTPNASCFWQNYSNLGTYYLYPVFELYVQQLISKENKRNFLEICWE